MQDSILLVINAALVNNFVLVKSLGLCPFMGVSRKLDTAIGMGLSTTFVLTLSTICTFIINQYLLEPFNIGYLRIIAFILVISAMVQLTEMIIRKTSPMLYQLLGIYLPLITANCIVLGVSLLNFQEQRSLLDATLYSFGAAIGFSLALILFSAMRERIAVADVPTPFIGNPIALITAGLMSMAFMGFAGLVPS
jgi:electron transport complex protein RnfA